MLLFERFEREEVVLVMSELLVSEAVGAPESVRRLLELHMYKAEYVKNSDEAKALAQKYIDEKVVGATSFDDCNHIAIATICHASVLASWNFKHIVNLQRIQGYNAVNLKNGYPTLEIRSPKDLISHETN